LDVARAGFLIPERLAECADVHSEIPRPDHQAAPYPRGQFAMADDLAGAIHQHDEDVERAIAEEHRHAIPLEATRGRGQPEWPERKGLVVRTVHEAHSTPVGAGSYPYVFSEEKPPSGV